MLYNILHKLYVYSKFCMMKKYVFLIYIHSKVDEITKTHISKCILYHIL